MPQVGPLEIAVIFIVALMVFGPDKIPSMARQAGKGMRELRRLQATLRLNLDDVLGDDDDDDDDGTTGRGPGRPPTLPPKDGNDPSADDGGAAGASKAGGKPDGNGAAREPDADNTGTGEGQGGSEREGEGEAAPDPTRSAERGT